MDNSPGLFLACIGLKGNTALVLILMPIEGVIGIFNRHKEVYSPGTMEVSCPIRDELYSPCVFVHCCKSNLL